MRQLTSDANRLTLQIIGIAAVISLGINDESNIADDVYLLLVVLLCQKLKRYSWNKPN